MTASVDKQQTVTRAKPVLASLVSCLLVAVLLRLWGIRWGLPGETHLFSYHPDEFHSLRGALAFLGDGDLNPHFFNYGSLYLYLVSLACFWHVSVFGGPDLIAALVKADTAHAEMAAWTLDARLVVVVLGIATVYVAWLAGRRLAGLTGATIAGLLMAVLPLHVLNSHYATVDVPQTFFIALCLYLSLKLADEGTWKTALWAGAAAGLAASVKYNGAVVFIVPVLALLLSHRGQSRTEEAPSTPSPLLLILGMAGAAAVAFAMTSPYVLLSWSEAWRDISFEIQHMREGESPVKEAYSNGWLFHLHLSTFLALAALLLLRGDVRRRVAPLAAFGLLWFLMIGQAGVRYARYEVPLEPVTAVLLAVLVAAWAQKPRQTWLGPAAVGALVLGSLWVNHAQLKAMAAENVRDTMLQRVLEAVPEDETLAIVWEPWFNVAPVDYCNGGAGLRAGPLFARFKRPVRELVVTGVDVETLRDAKPYAVLTSDFELDWRFAHVSDSHREFLRCLDGSGEYRSPLRVGRSPLWVPPIASDVRYPAPELRLYVRNSGASMPSDEPLVESGAKHDSHQPETVDSN